MAVSREEFNEILRLACVHPDHHENLWLAWSATEDIAQKQGHGANNVPLMAAICVGHLITQQPQVLEPMPKRSSNVRRDLNRMSAAQTFKSTKEELSAYYRSEFARKFDGDFILPRWEREEDDYLTEEEMGRQCKVCGKRFGEHYGTQCPEQEEQERIEMFSDA